MKEIKLLHYRGKCIRITVLIMMKYILWENIQVHIMKECMANPKIMKKENLSVLDSIKTIV